MVWYNLGQYGKFSARHGYNRKNESGLNYSSRDEHFFFVRNTYVCIAFSLDAKIDSGNLDVCTSTNSRMPEKNINVNIGAVSINNWERKSNGKPGRSYKRQA
jgi:hypothetical protein